MEEARQAVPGPHLPTLLVLGRVMLALGRPGDAAEAFAEITKADPAHAAARRLLGVALAGDGRFDEAVETWDTWSRLPARPADEDAQGGWVSRMRDAAKLLGQATRVAHG